MNTIEINALTREYGHNKGVFDLSLTVEEGECFGFLGPNGAGKTTTIRHLMGFLKPQKGCCTINGQSCWQHSAAIQTSLGYIPGEMPFFDEVTGVGFLSFLAQYRGLKGALRTKELLTRFELDAVGKLKKMSKGMKQKVGIVAAFMHDPSVLILDEPTSGLDPLMQNRFIELILEEKQRGKTILLSSHMFEEVERTCKRVAIIKDGRLAAIDSVDALKAAQVKQYVVTLADAAAAQEFAKEALTIISVEGAHVVVQVENNISHLISAMARHAVVNITAPNQSLEEIFLHYYGGAAV